MIQIRSATAFAAFSLWFLCGNVECWGQGGTTTIEQARQMLDLVSFPIPANAQLTFPRRAATLSYHLREDAVSAMSEVRRRLESQQWEVLPGAVSNEQFASAAFTKEGFRLSVAVTLAVRTGGVQVAINHLGNLKFDDLPFNFSSQKLFASPTTAVYLVDLTVEETANQFDQDLRGAGWRPFGTSSNIRRYLKNVTVLNVLISESASQPGKTSLSLTSHLISQAFPFPEMCDHIQYDDTTMQLTFESLESSEALLDYYRRTLAEEGWQSTPDRSPWIDLRDAQVFRNAAHDWLAVDLQHMGDRRRVTLRRMTEAEAAELRRATESLADSSGAMQSAGPRNEVNISLPEGAIELQQGAEKWEFKLPAGTGRAKVDQMIASFRRDRETWDEERPFWDAEGGWVLFTSGLSQVSVSFTDSGVEPAEVTISFSGVKLNLKQGP